MMDNENNKTSSAENTAAEYSQLANSEGGNEVLTTELHFDLLKQFAWLSSAAIGAVVVMLQLNAIEANKDIFISLGLLGFSILTAIYGQDYIVDSLLKGKNIYQIAKQLNRVRFITMFCFGIGLGYFSAATSLS